MKPELINENYSLEDREVNIKETKTLFVVTTMLKRDDPERPWLKTVKHYKKHNYGINSVRKANSLL